MARPFARRIGVIPFAAGTTVKLDLPRNHIMKGLHLRLTGLFTVAGGAVNGTLHPEQPQSLLKEVRINRNGSEFPQALDGPSLFQIAAFSYGTPPVRVAIGGAGVQANTPFNVTIPVDFASFGLTNPAVTMLKAVGNTSLSLDISWGTVGDIVTGGDRTNTLSNVQIEVFAWEVMDLTGQFGDRSLRIIQKVLSATVTDFDIPLPVGPMYRRLFFKVTNATVAPDYTLDNAALVDVRVTLDGVLYLVDRITFAAMQEHNKQVYSQETLQNGYAVYDFCEDGMLGGLISTAGASDVIARVNVTVAGPAVTLRVIPEVIIPSRELVAAA